ncbi:MAG: efflux RND transporter periplasmic adaptor subunit [bacterium]
MSKKIVGVILVVLVLLFGSYFYFKTDTNVVDNYVTANKTEVVQEVSVTGKVKPVGSASLAFNAVGKITKLNVDVGSRVLVGDVLASLDNADLMAQLEQAIGNKKAQQARLDELKKGTKQEELNVQQASVDSATKTITDSRNGLIDKINDSYTKSDDSIRNNIDRMFSNPRSESPKLSFVVSDSALISKLEFDRYIIEPALISWSKSLINLSADSNVDDYLKDSYIKLDLIKNFLDKLSLAVNSLAPNSNLSQTTIDSYKSETSSARMTINLAITSLLSAEEKLRNADSSLKLANEQMLLKKSGVAVEQIRAQEALVEQASASISNTRAQIDKTVLRSPINGIVTKKSFELGEIVSANTPVFAVITDSEFEMEANVPEADIAKIKIDDTAKVTLDAYGSDVLFEAKVKKIDPAETMIEGVATYKTTLQFVKKDDRIKSGMTANIDILTNKKEGVLAIPQRAIITRGGKKIVMINTGKKDPEERVIELGLRGSNGFTEVVSGLNEGDKIVGILSE